MVTFVVEVDLEAVGDKESLPLVFKQFFCVFTTTFKNLKESFLVLLQHVHPKVLQFLLRNVQLGTHAVLLVSEKTRNFAFLRLVVFLGNGEKVTEVSFELLPGVQSSFQNGSYPGSKCLLFAVSEPRRELHEVGVCPLIRSEAKVNSTITCSLVETLSRLKLSA